MTTATHAARSSDELTPRQITPILIGLMSGMFLAAPDQNVGGTAMTTRADGRHAAAWAGEYDGALGSWMGAEGGAGRWVAESRRLFPADAGRIAGTRGPSGRLMTGPPSA